MPATPKRQGRTPAPGARFLSQVLAANAGTYRRAFDFSQEDVAKGMRLLGHDSWSRVTVAEVERERRHVNVDELASLALVLAVPLPDLLDPIPPVRSASPSGLDTGLEGDERVMEPGLAHAWVRGQVFSGIDPDGDRLHHAVPKNPRLDPAGEAAVQALRGTTT